MARQFIRPLSNSGTFTSSATPNAFLPLISVTGKQGCLHSITAISATPNVKMRVTVDGVLTYDSISAGASQVIGITRIQYILNSGVAHRTPNTPFASSNYTVQTGYPFTAGTPSLAFIVLPIPFNNSLLIEIAHTGTSINNINYEYQLSTE